MKNTVTGILLFILLMTGGCTRSKRVKNVILMIPDGTSWTTVSSARWYQRYLDPSNPRLRLDPYLCGSVLTFSSNAPIGDSAPTTSCYMTGVPSRAGFVATYPPVDSATDIVPLNPAMSYRPLLTVLEAARIYKGMSTGLVFTCEFPHATPADCSAHCYSRNRYERIAPQMVHNDIDVVIGGGTRYLNEEAKKYLSDEGYGVYLDDLAGFRSHRGNKMWSLFGDTDMPFDLDNDTSRYPSLAEMTAKAIEKLSTNKNGFFLMVEGSKIDWAAHNNDLAGMLTDMLAFDRAFGVAVDFAKRNGETVVIAVPDHGNSGISIGSERCPSYSSMSAKRLFDTVTKFRATTGKIIDAVNSVPPEEIAGVFRRYANVELKDDEIRRIVTSSDYRRSNLSNEERMRGTKLKKSVAEILNAHTCFGFTTDGHTGEEVFLAVAAPDNRRPTGMIFNTELNEYMREILEIDDLLKLTDQRFAKHTEVLAGHKWKILPGEGGKPPVLEVERGANSVLRIFPDSNIALLDGREIKLGSVAVHSDKTDTFYIPRDILKKL
ncbi:MAG: alkaline phosphatase [Prevotellaceae bacterium]|jgi:alkaline phosphatase|nr:alkaline phosphatase [Prevotellaceae bacterium]